MPKPKDQNELRYRAAVAAHNRFVEDFGKENYAKAKVQSDKDERRINTALNRRREIRKQTEHQPGKPSANDNEKILRQAFNAYNGEKKKGPEGGTTRYKYTK